MKQYHIGIYYDRKREAIVYQLREEKDCMSCELLHYNGVTNHSKKWMQGFINLNYFQLIDRFKNQYPNKIINKIRLD